MEIGFDVISDLNLDPDDSFNWEGKVTSLYCIVAGNVSSDVRTVWQTLLHLSKMYQGVFYVMGSLEYKDSIDFDSRTKELLRLGSKIPNLAILHHHVVIIDGLAILGCNGWSNDNNIFDQRNEFSALSQKIEDIKYLKKSVSKLQKHLDVKKIMIVSNAVPKKELYFGENPSNDDDLELDMCIGEDTEMKISHWVFGTYKKVVDTNIHDINYINNSYYKVKPYWAKRININI
jgi:hypothetical protein